MLQNRQQKSVRIPHTSCIKQDPLSSEKAKHGRAVMWYSGVLAMANEPATCKKIVCMCVWEGEYRAVARAR